LDQQFPGDANGLISQRVAYHLFREIKDKANYLINFHTAATPYTAPPYTVYKVVPGVKPEVSQEVEKLARTFGLYGNCRVDISTAKGELPGGLGGALDVNCALQGIPAFMAEVGSGGKFEEENIAVSERGIKNVMKYLKMIPGEVEVPPRQITITKRRFLYCNKGGFLIMDVKPGTVLSKGEKIAHVIDLFSEIETLEAPEKAYIIQVRVNPIVHTGDRVAFLALEWEQVKS
jgi:predicted deacylase